MIPTRIAALAAILLALTVSQAEARPNPRQVQNVIVCNQQGCSDAILIKHTANKRLLTAHGRREVKQIAVRASNRVSRSKTVLAENVVFLPHPTGCPARAFCACGASVEVFGRSIRSLWPASAWLRFPRSSPGYKMVAVRSHHVFVLLTHIEGDIWLTADYNSGNHLSRRHAQSIRGYVIVNPHSSMAINDNYKYQ